MLLGVASGGAGRRFDPHARGRIAIGIGETSLEGATESGHVYDYESTHNGLGCRGDVVLEAMRVGSVGSGGRPKVMRSA